MHGLPQRAYPGGRRTRGLGAFLRALVNKYQSNVMATGSAWGYKYRAGNVGRAIAQILMTRYGVWEVIMETIHDNLARFPSITCGSSS